MSNDTRRLAARLLATSPHALSIDEARTHIATRRTSLLARNDRSVQAHESSFDPAPLPIVDAPELFAADFVKRRAASKAKPPKPAGRKPVGELPPDAGRFRIVDGGKDVDKPNGT